MPVGGGERRDGLVKVARWCIVSLWGLSHSLTGSWREHVWSHSCFIHCQCRVRWTTGQCLSFVRSHFSLLERLLLILGWPPPPHRYSPLVNIWKLHFITNVEDTAPSSGPSRHLSLPFKLSWTCGRRRYAQWTSNVFVSSCATDTTDINNIVLTRRNYLLTSIWKNLYWMMNLQHLHCFPAVILVACFALFLYLLVTLPVKL